METILLNTTTIGDTSNTVPVTISSVLGGIVGLLITLIITTLTVVMIVRVRSKTKTATINPTGHIYEDPDIYLKPSLPSRKFKFGVSSNEAYGKAFEMSENRAYDKKPESRNTETRNPESGEDRYDYIDPSEIDTAPVPKGEDSEMEIRSESQSPTKVNSQQSRSSTDKTSYVPIIN